MLDGVYFSRITDKRFKTNQITVNFYNDFDADSRADYSVASYILSDSCNKYPQYKELSARLLELYNATLTSNTVFSAWDQRCITLNASILDNAYALDGENLEAEICDIIRECLIYPNIENGVFSESVVSLMKSEVIDAIDSIVNDKATYAAQNANKTAYCGEPSERSPLGLRSEVENVTPQSAYNAYRKILETSRIEIFASGCSEFKDAKAIFSDMFSDIARHDICRLTTSPSPLKPKPEYAADTLPMEQAILRMYFKAPECKDREARGLLAMILGGMSTSRFFENIREQQSLCYYCSCFSNKYKRTLTAYAGVEPYNVEQCKNAILSELSDISQNGVSEEELRTAKLEYFNRISTIYDSQTAMISWYLNQLTDEEFFTPEEYYNRIEAVTSDRIKAAAAMFSLDTVYTLSGEEATE